MDINLPRETRLHMLRIENNKKLVEVAKDIGISASSLSAYENNEDKPISLYALKALAEYYDVTTDYLIGLTENRRENRTPIERLHLTDAAIRVIKSGVFNRQLLSEILIHPAFRRLMIDAEIYVDRIAESGVQNMNALLENARQSFIREQDADPEDLWMRTLKAGQIEEDEYFGNVLRTDLMEILKAIRETHKSDKTTADHPAAKKLENTLREYKEMKGTPEEKKIRLLCSQLGIPYDNFSPEEFEAFLKVFNSSKKLRAIAPASARGKSAGSHGPRKKRGLNKNRDGMPG